MSLLTLTIRDVCRIECGHPGILLVDVESKSFPDVVKVVQKFESTDQRCTVGHGATQVCRNPRHVHSTEGVFVEARVIMVARAHT